MPPSKIMIIRHAEKPTERGARGVDLDGVVDDEALSVRGWQRAGALVRFFRPLQEPEEPVVARPDHLFAIKVDPAHDPKSKRPKLTISPLARDLGVEVDQRFAKGDEDALVASLMGLEGVVLVAWAHSKIAGIAKAINGGSDGIPLEWPDERFDLVWVFDRRAEGWVFRQVPQRLLAGDA